MNKETEEKALATLKSKAEKGSRILENKKKGSRAGVYVSELGALLREVSSSPDRNNAYIEALHTIYEAGVYTGYQIATRETRNTK